MITATIIADAAPSAETTLQVFRDWVIIGSCLATVGIFFQGRRKQSNKREISPQPLEVSGEISKAPKRFNAALAESQHTEVVRRLDDHDVEIDKLWFTVREEDEKTRKETRDFVEKTSRSLGRIEGKLGTLPTEEQ